MQIDTTGEIYGFGEIVFDIIFKDNKIIDSQPGGSVLNSLVNLGVKNVKTNFISSLSNDKLGIVIHSFLKKHQISDAYISISDSPTKLALAFLNQNNNADYIFYGSNKNNEYKIPQLKPLDIFLFSSIASLKPENEEYLNNVFTKNKNNDAIFFYDPNIRSNFIKNNPESVNRIFNNFSKASIIRGSFDDFNSIFYTQNPNEIYAKVKMYHCHFLIITGVNEGIYVFTPNFSIQFNINKINVISSIGAGDAFNSIIIYELIKRKIKKSTLELIKKEEWEIIINKAIEVAQQVCLSLKNHL